LLKGVFWLRQFNRAETAYAQPGMLGPSKGFCFRFGQWRTIRTSSTEQILNRGRRLLFLKEAISN